MSRTNRLTIAFACLSFLAYSGPASAVNVFNVGHFDLEFKYETSGWENKVHDHDNDVDFDPADTILQAGANTLVSRPSDPVWAFTGVGAGASFFRLPQFQDPSMLYLGVATENESGQAFDSYFVNDPRVNNTARWVTVTLQSVTRREGGTGVFSIWTTDSFGSPTVWMSNFDGITPTDRLYIPIDSHLHYNYGLSQQGTYDIEFIVSGRIGGQDVTSGTMRYTLQAVPEPATMLVLGAGLAALAARRRRKA